MRDKTKPGAGDTGRRKLRRDGAATCLQFIRIDPFCQLLAEDLTPADHLCDLGRQALDRAWRAGVLADDCRRAGDLCGWETWRRRVLAHQAIAWAAFHFRQGRPGP